MIRAIVLACLIALLGGAACAVTPPYPAANVPLSPNDIFVCWQGGVTKNCTISQAAGIPPQRFEWYGITQQSIGGVPGFFMYVNHVSGSDTNNQCVLIATPCATWQHAINEASLFDVEGGNIVIHDTDTSGQSFPESVAANNMLRGSAGGGLGANSGFSISQIILDGNNKATITGNVNVCYGVLATNGAIVGVENIIIAANATACQDDLFAQLNGGINVYGGVTLGASGASGSKGHAEDTSYGIEIWADYNVTGSAASIWSVGADSLVLVNQGAAAITGSPTFQSAVFVGPTSTFLSLQPAPFGAVAWNSGTTYDINGFVLASDGNVYKTVAAGNLNHNPVGDAGVHWTLVPNPGGLPIPALGTATGFGFQVLPGGAIDTSAFPVAWPGSLGQGIIQGGVYRGDGFVTGAIPKVLSATGIGGGGTATVVGNTNNGEITITAGTSPSATGTVVVSFPFFLQYSGGVAGRCSAFPATDGTGSWNAGSVFQGQQSETVVATGTTFTWSNNSVNLTNTQTYTFNYSCQAGS